MNSITLFEFDKLVEAAPRVQSPAVPKRVFDWLQAQCLRRDEGAPAWLRQNKLDGKTAIQITSYVGVLRAPCGFQIEVLPKTGRSNTPDEARALLIEMLKCLRGFKHFQTQQADIQAVRMPLLEVFVQQFLQAVNALVKRGLRSDYVARQDNLFALRGRLLVARQITHNLVRRDRFHTEHDEFSQNRAENRLIHTALCQVLSLCRAQDNQRLARELGFVFAEVPLSTNIALDLQRIRLDRGMGYYEPALNWARLILQGFSPATGLGIHQAPSLLFSMQDLFEAYVAKHLARQLHSDCVLKTQVRSEFLTMHQNQSWFALKPDLLVQQKNRTSMVLDTKWKLLNAAKGNSKEKYQLSQADFYQLYAYGHHYLSGNGDLVLIYPKTENFQQPLEVFNFPKDENFRLWVLPFCFQSRKLILPPGEIFPLNIFRAAAN